MSALTPERDIKILCPQDSFPKWDWIEYATALEAELDRLRAEVTPLQMAHADGLRIAKANAGHIRRIRELEAEVARWQETAALERAWWIYATSEDGLGLINLIKTGQIGDCWIGAARRALGTEDREQ